MPPRRFDHAIDNGMSPMDAELPEDDSAFGDGPPPGDMGPGGVGTSSIDRDQEGNMAGQGRLQVSLPGDMAGTSS